MSSRFCTGRFQASMRLLGYIYIFFKLVRPSALYIEAQKQQSPKNSLRSYLCCIPTKSIKSVVKAYSSRRQESHVQRRRVTGAGAGARGCRVCSPPPPGLSTESGER